MKYLLLLLLAGCSTHTLPPKEPEWVENKPMDMDFVYSVGEGESKFEDDSLQKAYNSALLRFGMKYFPELNQISAQSMESLTSATFDRRSSQQLNLINWAGVEEVKSHTLSLGEVYKSHVLLKWKREDLMKAKILALKKQSAPGAEETEGTQTSPVHCGTTVREMFSRLGKPSHQFVDHFDYGKIRYISFEYNVNESPDAVIDAVRDLRTQTTKSLCERN